MTSTRPAIADVVRDRIDQWHTTGRADARGTLAEYPQLRDDKSLYLDLVLAEYAVRVAAGDEISHSAFCREFDAHQASIVHLLEAEDFVDHCPPFAELAAELRWPAVGEQFLGFEIVEPLGRGGLARVYLARELDVGKRFVVLKVSPFGGQEADTLGRIAHRSIVPIYTVKEDLVRGLSAISMPLLGVATGVDLLDAAFARPETPPAGDLVARVADRTRPLTPVPVADQETPSVSTPATYGEAIAALALQLAEGLAAAHTNGIMHRDLKPSNVLLAWSGRAMLLDFNLATGGEHMVRRIGGTLAYMAPERIDNLLHERFEAAQEFDPRSDIYSLGAVLYELLTGRRSHGAPPNQPRPDDYQGWLACKQPPLEPLGRQPHIEGRLAEIVTKCLALTAAERYSTAEQLAADLRAFLQPRARVARFVFRRRREFVLGGIAAGIVGAIGAGIAASRPSELEVQYRQGLAAYKQGKYQEAVDCFSRCAQIQAGWIPALFGRAQALRKLGRFPEARSDYLVLKDVEPGWCYALTGFCHVELRDYRGAARDYSEAAQEGLQNFDYLMNHAAVLRKTARLVEATNLYTKILQINPTNKRALRERALTRLAQTTNSRNPPDPGMLQDAEQYYQLETSYDGPFVCARVFADAARKDPNLENQAIRYLNLSIQRGLPRNHYDNISTDFKRLLPYVEFPLLEFVASQTVSAPRDGIRFNEPPDTADWLEFHRLYGRGVADLATNL